MEMKIERERKRKRERMRERKGVSATIFPPYYTLLNRKEIIKFLT